jgi:hypothetical protein
MFKWRRGKKTSKKKYVTPMEPPPDINVRVDKNSHFRVRSATQAAACGQ